MIKVHDGRTSISPTIMVLCNELAEVEVLSTSSELYIEFVANSNWPGQGFKASFQFEPLEPVKEIASNGKFSLICSKAGIFYRKARFLFLLCENEMITARKRYFRILKLRFASRYIIMQMKIIQCLPILPGGSFLNYK